MFRLETSVPATAAYRYTRLGVPKAIGWFSLKIPMSGLGTIHAY